jgi:hypothetical protein
MLTKIKDMWFIGTDSIYALIVLYDTVVSEKDVS